LYAGLISLIAVGDLFEVCSGNIKRPSRLLRALGVEWIARAVHERELFGSFVFAGPLLVVKTVLWMLRGGRV